MHAKTKISSLLDSAGERHSNKNITKNKSEFGCKAPNHQTTLGPAVCVTRGLFVRENDSPMLKLAKRGKRKWESEASAGVWHLGRVTSFGWGEGVAALVLVVLRLDMLG
ncbi:unnamed protein product [Prunus armeniaca]